MVILISGGSMIRGDRLKKLRIERGLTLKQLGEMLGGLDKSTISHYENEKREPDKETVVKMMQIFDASADYLIGADYFIKSYTDNNILITRVLTEEEMFLIDEIRKDKYLADTLFNNNRAKEIIREALKKIR